MSYDVEWYHHLPPAVKEILATLQSRGRKAFVVGGAVRDLWLGVEPNDFDLVSEATPEEIEQLFPKTIDVGRAFGIMIIVTGDGAKEDQVEVARFRADGAYTDGRHPDEVKFSDPSEDARRRDFTINALFYDPVAGQVLDYVGGVEDLKAKKIRAVGDASARFQEDSLRMLRAVRFHAQLGHLGFTLDEGLLASIKPLASRLALVSKERITQEMKKVYGAVKPSVGFIDLKDSGLWPFVISAPEVSDTILARLDSLNDIYAAEFGAPPTSLLFAATAAWIPGFEPEKTFLLSRETKTAVAGMRAVLKELPAFTGLGLAGKKRIVGHEFFPQAWAIAKVSGAGFGDLRAMLEFRKEKEAGGLLHPTPLLNGSDLVKLGFAPGPEIKKVLEEIRLRQWNEEISGREEAERIALSFKK